MANEDRRADDNPRARRRRAIKTGCHVFVLLIGSMYLLAFTVALQTGYLSWIGIIVGALLAVPGVISPSLGLAGWKRLSAVSAEVSVGVMLLMAIVLQVSLLRTKSDVTGDWRPYRFDTELAALEARRAVPEVENAAHRYESVLAVMDLNDEPDFLFMGSSLRDEFGEQPWRGEEYPQAGEWLDAHSQIIDQLLAIGRMEKCRWPVRADIYDDYTVPHRKLRRSVLLLTVAGNRDLGEGRVTEALTKYFCILRIGDHLHQQPSEVDSLTGFRAEEVSLKMIRHVLVQNNLSEEQIAQIASHLPPAADPWPQEWERLLEHEKLHYMNLLGRLYEVDEAGHVRFAGKIVISPRDEREQRDPVWIPRIYWLMSMPRDPHGLYGIADRYFAEFNSRIRSGPLPQEKGYGRPARVSLNDSAKGVCNAHRWGIEMVFFDEGEYLRHRQWRAPSIAGRRGTWLVLGLRRYRNMHGTWPQTLEAVSQYVPVEAFLDPLAGEAFVYASDGDSFTLYSKGPNRVDEGGRSRYVRALGRSEDDIAVWPPPVWEPDPEPMDEESMKRQFEQIYGKEYAETMFRQDPNDER